MIKLLIGGSPCTHWSIAQKNNRETEPQGIGWELFKNYLIAKEKFNPDFFLYENNKSAAQPIKDQIAKELGVDLMYINSALVSAQNRQRFYAFNWTVEQPEDREIVLRDILESGECETIQKAIPKLVDKFGYVPEQFNAYNLAEINDKSPTLSTGSMVTSSCATTIFEKCNEPIRVGTIENNASNKQHDSKQYRVYSPDGKSTTLCGNGGGVGAKTGLYACPFDINEPIWVDWDRKTRPVYEVKNGLITIKGKQYPVKLADGCYIIRKLTPIECERLQTLPDNYTAAVSNAQRYKGIGNGWTAEVIIHILNGALKDVPRDEEIVVFSMYDGIGTGRYCLDKMGFTNVRYYAYEIDKYAKQVAMSNYPDIIQCGDAFAVRENEWRIGGNQ